MQRRVLGRMASRRPLPIMAPRNRRATSRSHQSEGVDRSASRHSWWRDGPREWGLRELVAAGLVGLFVGAASIAGQVAIDDGREVRAIRIENLRFVRERSTGDPDQPRPFAGLDLQDQNLSRLNLAHAMFSYANLSGANLMAADMIAADLTGANLARADLSGANLSHGQFQDADLSGATLAGTNLTHASLSQMDLAGVSLVGANLTNTDLSGADLTRANLTGAILANTDLTGANLAGAKLELVDLQGICRGPFDEPPHVDREVQLPSWDTLPWCQR